MSDLEKAKMTEILLIEIVVYDFIEDKLFCVEIKGNKFSLTSIFDVFLYTDGAENLILLGTL